MSSLFETDGENLDLGYKNLREGKFPQERAMCSALNKMWGAYEPYADPDFREGFARDPDGRFWEFYLGSLLLAAGKKLLPTTERLVREGFAPSQELCLSTAHDCITTMVVFKFSVHTAAAPQPKANTNTFTDILVSLAFDRLFAPSRRITSAKSIMICVVVPVIRVDGGALPR
jgi:hypothetical protein